MRAVIPSFFGFAAVLEQEKPCWPRMLPPKFSKDLMALQGGVKLGFHFAQHGPPIAESSATEAEPPGHSLAKVASDLLYSILQQDGTLFDGCKAELKKQGFFTNPSSLWKALRKAIQDCQTDPV